MTDADFVYAGKKSLKFTVEGRAVGQGRPRASTIHGCVRMFDPKKSVEAKKMVRAAAQEVVNEAQWNILNADVPVSIEITEWREAPAHFKMWAKGAAWCGASPCPFPPLSCPESLRGHPPCSR